MTAEKILNRFCVLHHLSIYECLSKEEEKEYIELRKKLTKMVKNYY